jgi:hypothetical protein
MAKKQLPPPRRRITVKEENFHLVDMFEQATLEELVMRFKGIHERYEHYFFEGCEARFEIDDDTLSYGNPIVCLSVTREETDQEYEARLLELKKKEALRLQQKQDRLAKKKQREEAAERDLYLSLKKKFEGNQ